MRELLASVALVALCSVTLPSETVGQETQQIPCYNAGDLAKLLNKKYGEQPVSIGLQSNGNLLQVYYSKTNNTWTMVTTTPGGPSCVVASGSNWENLPDLTNPTA